TLNRLPTGTRDVIDVDSIRDIRDKGRLYHTLTTLDPSQDVVLPSKNLEESDTLESLNMGDIVIVRPVGRTAFQGKGISIVTSNRELKDAWQTINDNPKWTHATVSAYLTDPLLYQGKKMHLRIAVLVTSWGSFKLYGKSGVITAKLPYVEGDYKNKDIHDSHRSSTTTFAVFPDSFLMEPSEESPLPSLPLQSESQTSSDSFPSLPLQSESQTSSDSFPVAKMTEGIDKIYNLITKAIRGKVRSYEESKFAYELLGLDVMFRKDGSAVLL